MEEKLICPVCGEPTSSYMGHYRKDRLCKKHAAEFKNGELILCEKCKKWHDNRPCGWEPDLWKKTPEKSGISTESKRQADGKCIVCGKDAPNGSLCKDCYYEMLDYKKTFDKNAKVFELNDYYFNLRSNIYRMKSTDYIKSNCNKLMALAVLTKELYGNQALTDRIVNDIKDIIEKKLPKEERKLPESAIIQDSKKEELIRTDDGHYVKSHPESVIDDLLYDLRIVHCYEKKVPINADEKTVTADWFIPVIDSRHGIYIEYWGMNTKDYLENKERKRKAYKEHDIPLIEIEREDYLDKQGLGDRLISEINTLARKYFRIIDFKK